MDRYGFFLKQNKGPTLSSMFLSTIRRFCQIMAFPLILTSKRTKITAIVADSYEFNRHLHKLLLEKEGVEVTIATDGKEVLETYIGRGGEYFDFIMMDARMSVMDGLQAAKKIREWERERNKKKVDIYFYFRRLSQRRGCPSWIERGRKYRRQ